MMISGIGVVGGTGPCHGSGSRVRDPYPTPEKEFLNAGLVLVVGM